MKSFMNLNPERLPMRLLALLLISAISLASSSAFAASYQYYAHNFGPNFIYCQSCIIDPIQNVFGGNHSYSGINLEPGANLTNANLSNAYLWEVDLLGTVLSGANFSGANLQRAHLTNANLSDANFSGANLAAANLYDANLSGAGLIGANLTDANLTYANLTDANLTGAVFCGTTMPDGSINSSSCGGGGVAPGWQ